MNYLELGDYRHANRRIEWSQGVNQIRQWLHEWEENDTRIAVGIVSGLRIDDIPVEIKQIFLPNNWVLT